MRNPKWHRDEIILALELYFRTESGHIHDKNPEIIELSEILNKLPIFEFRPDAERFRNPNGVALKLSNFLAIDPTYPGKGMKAFSHLDKEVFDEFVNEQPRLTHLAHLIRETVTNKELNLKLYNIQEEESSDKFEVKEGKVLYKLHKYRERDLAINKKKKEKILKENGKLACKVCNFDFNDFYGEIGKGYIECHHKTPLSEMQAEVRTALIDLALVCSNCHRMLHKEISVLSIQGLKERIRL